MKPIHSPTSRSHWRTVLQGCVLVAMVCLIYLPALRGGFLWDDDVNVTQNEALRSLHGLGKIWFHPGVTQQYYPLTHTSFWLDYHLWGTNPLAYHLENILLHALGAVLLWRILQWLRVPGAWLGAALFAVHPVCVESVAWITQRKNTLCGIFFLASILAALRFWLPVPTPRDVRNKSRIPEVSVPDSGPWKFYLLALALYLCALWAKTAAVGLPVVIALLLWWKRGRIGRRDIGLLAPFLAVGMAISLITIKVEAGLGAAQKDFQYSVADRCLIASRAVCFYLGKLVWPHPLVFIYPRWDIHASQPVAYLPLLAAVGCLLFLWQKRRSWGRPVLVVLGFFLALLFPVAGFFNQSFFSYSFVSDHFQYLACIGPLALAAAGLTIARDHSKWRRISVTPLICLALLALGALTWAQTRIYRDLQTLWGDVLIHNPDGWAGHYNLGLVLVGQGKIDDGIQQYTEALKGNSNYAAIYDNLGNALARNGQSDEAIRQYTAALKIEPGYANARNNLGNTLLRKGDLDGAIQQYTKALEINPGFADAHYNLGNALLRKGNPDEAMLHFNRALQIKPDYAAAHNKLGFVLSRQAKLDEAIQHYRLALQIEPDLIYTRYNLGNLLGAKGDLDGAIEQFFKVVQSKPDFAEAQGSLGEALAAKGRLEEAVAHFRISLQINPNQPEAHYGLGMALLKQGKTTEARAGFIEALRLKPGYRDAVQQLQALSSLENVPEPVK